MKQRQKNIGRGVFTLAPRTLLIGHLTNTDGRFAAAPPRDPFASDMAKVAANFGEKTSDFGKTIQYETAAAFTRMDASFQKLIRARTGRIHSRNLAVVLADTEVKAVNRPNAFTGLPQTEVRREAIRLWAAFHARLEIVDNHYQRWVYDHIDPLFGRRRQAQQRDLLGNRDLDLSPQQRQANHSLAIGMLGLGLAGLSSLLSIPVWIFSSAIGLYLMIPSAKVAYKQAVHDRKFSSTHVELIYFAGMWFGGYLVIGALGLIMMTFARKVKVLSEAYTQDQLADIFGRQPRQAWMLVDGVEIEASLEQVQVGDVLVIDVSQMIPVDGVIVEGAASIDQHMLTGEAQPVELGVGDSVLAATIVLSGRILVRVERAGTETTAAQIKEILNRTTRYRSSIEERAAQLADRSLVPMLIGSGLGFIVGGPAAAFAILGCNFVMSMLGLAPLTLLNFLNDSSRRGILVKDGEALEKLRSVDTMVFDKTGTLTIEQPHLIGIHLCAELDEEGILRLAAAAEHRQVHPIARAILAAADERQLRIPRVADAHYEVGYGIKVQVIEAFADQPHALPVRVGSWRFMELEGVSIPASMQALIAHCQAQGHSLVFVATDAGLVGALELRTTVRAEAQQVMEALRRMGKKLYIISGDQEAPTQTLARELGMDGYFANTLPQHKADLVSQLKAEGRSVCFIGDGINDAIALKKADVSISLHGATTAATDTAQVVLMDAHLEQLITLLELVDELHKNLELNLRVAGALSVASAGGVLFFHAGFVIVEIFFAGQFLTGVSIASMPLLKQPGDKNRSAARWLSR